MRFGRGFSADVILLSRMRIIQKIFQVFVYIDQSQPQNQSQLQQGNKH